MQQVMVNVYQPIFEDREEAMEGRGMASYVAEKTEMAESRRTSGFACLLAPTRPRVFGLPCHQETGFFACKGHANDKAEWSARVITIRQL